MLPFTLDQCWGQSKALKAKYGKILPELAEPEERGPSSISEAKEDKNDMLWKLNKSFDLLHIENIHVLLNTGRKSRFTV